LNGLEVRRDECRIVVVDVHGIVINDHDFVVVNALSGERLCSPGGGE